VDESLVFGGLGSGSAAAIRESVQVPVSAGSLSNLRVWSHSPDGLGVYTEVYLLVNGGYTGVWCGLTPGTGCSSSLTATVFAGDLISLAVYYYTAGPAPLVRTNYSLEFRPATSN
jgi:hypothetical protein